VARAPNCLMLWPRQSRAEEKILSVQNISSRVRLRDIVPLKIAPNQTVEDLASGATQPERRDESRRGRLESLRHVSAADGKYRLAGFAVWMQNSSAPDVRLLTGCAYKKHPSSPLPCRSFAQFMATVRTRAWGTNVHSKVA
jgi:hypothetical protein